MAFIQYYIAVRWLWRCAACWLVLAAAVPGRAQAVGGLHGDLRVHDPAMIRAHGVWYVYSTGRGIPFKKSPDRIHWKNAGRVFSRQSLPAWHQKDIPGQDGNLWAPDIHYYEGTYYLYYAVSAWMNFHSAIGLATNTTLDPSDPHYKWVDRGMVIDYTDGGAGVNVIDPSVFTAGDGATWLVYGSYKAGLRMTRLDPATGLLQQHPPSIITLTRGLGEGSCIIRGPHYYYLFASRGRCCAGLKSTYQIVMGRSLRVEGPYLNKQGDSLLAGKYSLFLAGDYQEPGRGGNSFCTEGDTTFIVYHAYTRSAGGASLLNIRPLYAGRDGWPTADSTGALFRRSY
jgi:arabinan endo-1,5-alpha-L-arabinosidase